MVTVAGAHFAHLYYDARHNKWLAEQLRAALCAVALPPPRDERGVLIISLDHAIRAGLVSFVNFD